VPKSYNNRDTRSEAQGRALWRMLTKCGDVLSIVRHSDTFEQCGHLDRTFFQLKSNTTGHKIDSRPGCLNVIVCFGNLMITGSTIFRFIMLGVCSFSYTNTQLQKNRYCAVWASIIRLMCQNGLELPNSSAANVLCNTSKTVSGYIKKDSGKFIN